MAIQTHRWVVDVIEETAASIEVDGGAVVAIPRWLLPGGAREGDVLRVMHDRTSSGLRATLTVEVDPAARESALEESREQMERARRRGKDPGGDIVL